MSDLHEAYETVTYTDGLYGYPEVRALLSEPEQIALASVTPGAGWGLRKASPDDWLRHAFEWAISPQTHTYWFDIYIRLVTRYRPPHHAATSVDSILPTEAKARKAVPVYSGVLAYFPLALAEIAKLSRDGNEQHNPGSPLHWDRSKSGDEKDALTRHLLQAGTKDTDGHWHDTKVAWRALANLQKLLESKNGGEEA